MTPEEFKNLRRGDIIRHKSDDSAMVITEANEVAHTAVRTLTISNPEEWIQFHPGRKKTDPLLTEIQRLKDEVEDKSFTIEALRAGTKQRDQKIAELKASENILTEIWRAASTHAGEPLTGDILKFCMGEFAAVKDLREQLKTIHKLAADLDETIRKVL